MQWSKKRQKGIAERSKTPLPSLKDRRIGCHSSGPKISRSLVPIQLTIPLRSMYGIFTYIWLISIVKVGTCTIYGWYWIWNQFYNHIHNNTCYGVLWWKIWEKCIIPDICSKWNTNIFGGRNVSLGIPPSCFLLGDIWMIWACPKKHIPQTLSKKTVHVEKKTVLVDGLNKRHFVQWKLMFLNGIGGFNPSEKCPPMR